METLFDQPDVFRIAYFGARGSGKTSCIEHISAALTAMSEHQMPGAPPTSVPVFREALDPADPHSPECESLSLNLGWIGGAPRAARVQTLPLDMPGKSKRTLVNANAIIFVVDSSPAQLDANREAAEWLNGVVQHNPNCVIVLMLNKRDLEDALDVESLHGSVNPWNALALEAIASEGLGVMAALTAAVKLMPLAPQQTR